MINIIIFLITINQEGLITNTKERDLVVDKDIE